MDIKYYEYFLILAEKQSISEAARSIYMEQSGLSKIITKLENHYGTALFERTPRGIKLTPNGELLLENAKHITEWYHDSLRKISSEALSSLLVHYTVGVSRWLIPACHKSFMKMYPGTKLDTHFFPLEDIHTVYSTHRPDITLIFSFAMDARMQEAEKVCLMEDPLALVVSADHSLATRQSITSDELKSIPIVFVDGPSMDNTIELLSQSGGEINAHKCPNVQTADNLIRCQIGAGVRTMSDKRENPELCYVPIEGVPPAKLYAVLRSPAPKQEVHDFIHCIRSVLWHF